MKKAIITLAVIVAAVLVVISGNEYYNNQIKRENLKEVSQEIAQQNAVKANVENDIAALWDEYDKTVGGGSCVVLFFDNVTDNLMDKVYPLVTEYGFVGTVVLDDGKIPGQEGLITIDDYFKLINSGWDFAIGSGALDLSGSDADEKLEEYIANYKQALYAVGIPMPMTFCFGDGDYKDSFDDVLINNGFEIVRHYGEAEDVISGAMHERDELYYLGSGMLCAKKTSLSDDVEEAYINEGTISISTRYIMDTPEDRAQDCTKSKYILMLDYLSEDCEGVKVVTASKLYWIKKDALSQSADYIAEFNAKLSDLEKSLSDIKAKIKELQDSVV